MSPTLDPLAKEMAEVERIVDTIRRAITRARRPEDWDALMRYTAGHRTRVSDLASRANELYAQGFGDVYDRTWSALNATGVRAKSRPAVIRAEAESSELLEICHRFEQLREDLTALVWVIRNVLQHLDPNRPSFEAYPERLFGQTPAADYSSSS